MWKALINKIFKKAKTAEGAAGIGGALFGGWLGSSMGIAAPSLIPAIFGTAVSGIFPVAAVGAGFGYLAVKIIKYKAKLSGTATVLIPEVPILLRTLINTEKRFKSFIK